MFVLVPSHNHQEDSSHCHCHSPSTTSDSTSQQPKPKRCECETLLSSCRRQIYLSPDSIYRAVLLHLLTQYRMSGGYTLSTLRDIVEELRLEMEGGAPLEEREARGDDREVVHIIPS
jgi:hypothetical protein